MSITINDLFNRFGLIIRGQTKWNKEINSDRCGVYVVALSDDRNQLVTIQKPDFNDSVIRDWINLIKSGGKTLLINNKPATIDLIKERLTQFWLPDETILYIGKAGPTQTRTLRVRVNEYYNTKLGCDKRHAGGHWLNTLKNLSDLNIYYSQTNPDIEEDMIKYFSEQVTKETRNLLYDKINCFPFANKEMNKSTRKLHGLLNQTIDCGSNWEK